MEFRYREMVYHPNYYDFHNDDREEWYDHVTSAYKEEPAVSAERIFKRAKELFPESSETALRKGLKLGSSYLF